MCVYACVDKAKFHKVRLRSVWLPCSTVYAYASVSISMLVCIIYVSVCIRDTGTTIRKTTTTITTTVKINLQVEQLRLVIIKTIMIIK